MVFKIVLGFVGALLGIVGVVLVGALILLIFFLIFEPGVLNGFAPDIISNWTSFSPDKMVLISISLLLILGCPIFLLIYWAIRLISGKHDTPHTASWVVLILWIAGLFMFYSVGANAFLNFHRHNDQRYSLFWDNDDKPYEDEIRECDSFNAIDLSGNIELELRNDSTKELRVSFVEGYLPKVITKVENGVLHIYSEDIFIFQNKPIKVSVYSDSIQYLTAKGACKIESKYPLTTKDFTLNLLGASQADLDVNVSGLFKLDVKGASKVDLRGSSNIFNANGIGASDINAEELKAKQVDVHVAGASHAKVFASESINAEAYGASEIKYKGNPKNVKKSDGGASSIEME